MLQTTLLFEAGVLDLELAALSLLHSLQSVSLFASTFQDHGNELLN